MKRFVVICLVAYFLLYSISGPATFARSSDDPERLAGASEAAQDPAQAPPELSFRRDQQPEIKPYDKVITKEAKSDEGVFTVHRIKEKVYYEIPEERTRQRVSLGEPDSQDDAWRRLWRTGAGQPRREVGTSQQQSSPSKRRLRCRSRSQSCQSREL